MLTIDGVTVRFGGVKAVDNFSTEVADGEIWATAVKVTVAPGSRSTVLWMLPVPVAGVTLAPAEATVDQFVLVIPAGKRSATVAPVTALGPLLLTTIV